MKRLLTTVFALILCAAALPAWGGEVEVRVSGQPCLHGLPNWWAMETGEEKKDGIAYTYTLFPSGAPQNEALAADQWDVGNMGTVPTIMAVLRYGAKIVAVSNDESETNDIWVRPDSPLLHTKGAMPGYPDIYGKPEDWKNKKILVTTVSTSHYALSRTLKALGLTDKDVELINIEQAQAITAFSSGNGDIVALFAPYGYIAESKGWKKVSSGRAAGVVVPGGCVVRKGFAEEHPDEVVKWLIVQQRMFGRMIDDKPEAQKWLTKYFKDYCGLVLPEEAIAKEFQLRPLFKTDAQIQALTDPTKLQAWMADIVEFFVEQKQLTRKNAELLKAMNYGIDATFIQKVAK